MHIYIYVWGEVCVPLKLRNLLLTAPHIPTKCKQFARCSKPYVVRWLPAPISGPLFSHPGYFLEGSIAGEKRNSFPPEYILQNWGPFNNCLQGHYVDTTCYGDKGKTLGEAEWKPAQKHAETKSNGWYYVLSPQLPRDKALPLFDWHPTGGLKLNTASDTLRAL